MNCIAGYTVKDFSSWLKYSSLLEQQKWHPATGVKNAVSPLVFEQSAIAICYSFNTKQRNRCISWGWKSYQYKWITEI